MSSLVSRPFPASQIGVLTDSKYSCAIPAVSLFTKLMKHPTTDYRTFKMAKISVSGVLFITVLLAASTNGFRCRDGIENSVGYIWSSNYCGDNVNKTKACFQSLKCTSIGDTDYKDYEWRCFERKNCQNGTDGKSYGRYKGTRGICCFTSSCNAYRLNTCTDSASSVTTSIISLISGLLLTLVIP